VAFARFRGLPVGLAGMGFVLSTLAGCSSMDKSALPPRKSEPQTSSTPAHPTTPSIRDVVVRTYTTYWVVGSQASKVTLATARRMLKPFAAGDYFKQVVAGISDLQSQGRETWGHVTVHITNVRVKGRSARITDCQDASQAGLADAHTHQLISGTTGKARTHVQADLVEGADTQWRVVQLIVLESVCTPEASS
jgi:hypothetical protein